MPSHDGWDWPLLLYVGTVILKRPEKQFWRMTPRKFNALVRVHIRLNDPDEQKKMQEERPAAFIDQIF
jgi:uncharacterized phage protein (TIGR02216 family)